MNLFAYGTLMWPAVLQSVIGRRLEGTQAVVQGYQRFRIKNQDYPGLMPSAGDEVVGMLYSDLSASEFHHLDRFEGEEYDRVTVQINGVDAEVYVLAERWCHIADEQIWNPDRMTPERLASFCKEYKGWSK